MKKLITLLFFISSLSHAQTQEIDTIIFHTEIKCDTTVTVDTIFKPVTPQSVSVLKGIYGHPDFVTIGNAASENKFLAYYKGEGATMINMYCRAFLATDSKRAQLAAFVKKAKEQYGIIYFTVDVRGVNEIPNWMAYGTKYGNTNSEIHALTEWDVHNDLRYTEFFQFLPAMAKVAKQYGFDFNFYGGWPGKNNPAFTDPIKAQAAAWDSISKYTHSVFISNYIPQSDYLASGGAWDGRMDKRSEWYASGCKRNLKVGNIVEIASLELIRWGANNNFLGNIFACPKTTLQLCYPFFDLVRTTSDYKKSTSNVLLNTKLIGRTMFMIKYCKLAHP